MIIHSRLFGRKGKMLHRLFVLYGFVALVISGSQTAAGEFDNDPMHHKAYGPVPVVITDVRQSPNYTEVHFKTLKELYSVCWNFSGPDAPYLLSEGTTYPLMEGVNVTRCPTRREYYKYEKFTLIFLPIDNTARQFNLIEGEAGLDFMNKGGKLISGQTFWNFLGVPINSTLQ